jgi:hypothetical protein
LEERKRRHDMKAICIMRNAAAVNGANAEELIHHSKVMDALDPLALHNVQPSSDEFLLCDRLL